jgi:hypothetical protein
MRGKNMTTNFITWRQLINELQKYPHLLDEPALVWVPDDSNHPLFSHISGVDALDASQPATKNNELSINIEEYWD